MSSSLKPHADLITTLAFLFWQGCFIKYSLLPLLEEPMENRNIMTGLRKSL